MLGSFLPDVLIMTVPLPEADASAVVRLLRAEERYARTHLVIATQLPETDRQIIELRGLGCAEIVPGPLAADTIVAASRRALAASQSLPEGASTASPDDEDAARELGLSLSEYRRIADRFLADAPRKADELTDAAARGDTETVERLAHAIKGDALNLRLVPVSQAAVRIESMAREHSISAGRGELHELRRALEGLKISRQSVSTARPPDDEADHGRPVGSASLAELGPIVDTLQAAVRRRSLTRVTEAAEQLVAEAKRLGRTDVFRLAESVGQEARQARLTGMREAAQRLADLMEEER